MTWFFKILIYISVGYFCFLLVLYFFQRHLIYFPESNFPIPEAAGVPEMRVINLYTKDHLILKSWYKPPNLNHPMILYLHGNGGHIGYRAEIVQPFLRQGYGALLLTYRGYSGNPGKPSEQGLYEDARTAVEFLKGEKIPLSCIVLIGESIGGAVALKMATEYSLGALILQAPFTSLAAIGQYHFPLIPIRWFLKDEYPSIQMAKQINIPIYILHGQNDDIIPKEFSEELYKAFNTEKKRDVIPHRGHNNLYEPNRMIHFINKSIHCRDLE
jgi:fermentation-respiration switch protein FrsA (DUF1100 family)